MWNHRCDGSVQHGKVAALRSNEKSKSRKNVITLSYWHSECFVFESQSSDGGCTLRDFGAAIIEPRQICVVFF